MYQRGRRILRVFGKDTVADQDARPGRREHHVSAIKVDIAVCNRQTKLRSKILTKVGPQDRIVFQIGRLIAEGYQLSGACPHRHEVSHPNIPCAIQHLRIYFLGMPFIMIFNFGSAILRSLGDTRRPLYILIWAGIINTVLNLLFVIVFHMGVEGVAIATGISNLFSAVMVVQILLREQDPYKLHLDDMHIQKDELSHMLEIGVPAGLQGVVFSISNVIIQASINSYGFNAVAGSAAALNFEQYCYYVIAAFNGAAISFVGQNYGAGNMDRVKRIFLICMGLGTLSCALLNWVFAGWSDFFLGLFTDSQTVKDFGTIRMRTVLMFQGLACLYEIPGSALRGMGRSMLPTLLTVFGTCVLRIAWVYTVCPVWEGFHALMFVYPVSWIITGIMVMTAYLITFRRIQLKSLTV